MKNFDKLSGWLYSEGYDLRWGKSCWVDEENSQVNINPNLTGLNLIYTILHECGHVKLFSYDTYEEEFKSIARVDDGDRRHTNSLLYRYKKIKEEIDAWEEGYNIALELSIKINKDKYDKYAAKWVYTYMVQLSTPHPSIW